MYDADESRCELGIDCPPGDPRPGDLLPGVLEGSGLEPSDFEEPLRLYGAWTWQLRRSPDKEALFISRKPLFHARLEALLAAGTIRGGLVNPPGPHLRIVE